ncbi:7110_t:CDS:1, partial [Funneliformis geosporum]
SHEIAIIRSLKEIGGKVTQLSDPVAFFKSIIPDMKKAIVSAEKSIDL